MNAPQLLQPHPRVFGGAGCFVILDDEVLLVENAALADDVNDFVEVGFRLEKDETFVDPKAFFDVGRELSQTAHFLTLVSLIRVHVLQVQRWLLPAEACGIECAFGLIGLWVKSMTVLGVG